VAVSIRSVGFYGFFLGNFTDFAFNSDTIARIPLATTLLAETPSTDILGLVVYDLPGRDCNAKASNGELATGQLAKYQSDYIDRKYTAD